MQEQKFYRVVLKGTNYYYQPVRDGNNLSKRGKVYQSNNSCLSGKDLKITAMVNTYTKVGKEIQNSHIFSEIPDDVEGRFFLKIPKSKFEKEYIV